MALTNDALNKLCSVLVDRGVAATVTVTTDPHGAIEIVSVTDHDTNTTGHYDRDRKWPDQTMVVTGHSRHDRELSKLLAQSLSEMKVLSEPLRNAQPHDWYRKFAPKRPVNKLRK